jgi:hypothetical protein
MKKCKIITFVVLIVLLNTPLKLRAQYIEITPFVGYETIAKVATSYGYLGISDGMNFGGAISFGVDPESQIEFSYNHMNSELSLDEGGTITHKTAVNIDYYMLGAVIARQVGEIFYPFGSGSLGWVHYGTPEENYGNENCFAVNIAAGLKILFNEWVGLRMQARLSLPLHYGGAYFSTGTEGTGYGAASTCVMVQGDFTGAIFIMLE